MDCKYKCCVARGITRFCQFLAVTMYGLMLTVHAAQAGAKQLGDGAPEKIKVTVGVQIIHDSVDELAQWQRWLKDLSESLPNYAWELAPLRWDALRAAVQAGQLHFAVTSPGHSVALEARHGAVRMASQLAVEADIPMHAVGSAVLVAQDSPWRRLSDLKGQPVAAVAADAFGGYQVVAAQWLQDRVSAAADDVPVLFTGYPMERTVQALQEGRVQAAIVRVCMLEHMVARGLVAAQKFRVLPARQTSEALPQTHCQASSPLYPGWALAALPQTPQALSHAVMVTLLLQQSSQAGMRWTVAADYQAVHEVLQTLKVEPYAPLPTPNLGGWLWQYRYLGGAAATLLLLGMGYLLHVEALVKRRTSALSRSMQERDALAQQVAQAREKMDHMGRLSVLGELSATLAHEISHPLASVSNYVTGLRRRQREGSLAPAQLASALEAIEESVLRTARVLDSMRALARKRVSVQRQAMLWPVRRWSCCKPCRATLRAMLPKRGQSR
jgi:two-component system sensor histidine kinase TtrS